MRPPEYEQTQNAVLGLMSGRTGVPEAEIREKVSQISTFITNLSAELQEELVKEFLSDTFGIFSQDYQILTGDNPEQRPWLLGRRDAIDWRFWRRYRLYLQQRVKLAADTINKLDNLTDDILDRVADPRQEGPWKRRGLVVGNVQSGKTGNYTGLICKAADAGYRVIIVLTGLHSSLRSQTQHRLDEGFLGRDTNAERAYTPGKINNIIGAGEFGPTFSAYSITNSAEDGDFRANRAPGTLPSGTDPVLFVIKKNGTVLKNLITWLGASAEVQPDGSRLIKGMPLLLIDDEADNASINVSKEAISTINGAIRALLSLFEQQAYVAYTATPYANVFIPMLEEAEYADKSLRIKRRNAIVEFAIGQDLFPRDFIVNLPAPSNYIGAARIFGLGRDDEANGVSEALLPIVRVINDYGAYIPDKHKKADPRPDALPPSLIRAVKCFILSSAIRRARGQGQKHSSMLIHVSRFTDWQDHIAEMVDDVLKGFQNELRYATDGQLEASLKEIWETDYKPATAAVAALPAPYHDHAITVLTWDEIQPHLKPAASKMTVRVAHGSMDKTGGNPLHRPLNYVDHEGRNVADDDEASRGLSVIAVGGDRLARGLTLEGLSVSYFLRASKMYDTLMQMGRWFGYRPGYADVCRLFTTAQLFEWYQYIAFATEEMRDQFDQMALLNQRPIDYGLKIRTLPGILQITAASKMRSATTLELSYADSLIETYSFERSDKVAQANYQRTRELLERLPAPVKLRDQSYGWQNVPADQVLDFLRGYQTRQLNIESGNLTRYIEAQNIRGALTNWTVVLIEAGQKKAQNPSFPFPINGSEVPVVSSYRRDASIDPKLPGSSKSGTHYLVSKSHILGGIHHEYLDLTEAEVEQARQAEIKAKSDPQYQSRRRTATTDENGNPIPPVVKYPSGPFVRQVRPEKNALLLLYPLDPGPVGTSTDRPMMGYAISFPSLSNDVPVKYAVNRVFMEELFGADYDQVDPEEERALLS